MLRLFPSLIQTPLRRLQIRISPYLLLLCRCPHHIKKASKKAGWQSPVLHFFWRHCQLVCSSIVSVYTSAAKNHATTISHFYLFVNPQIYFFLSAPAQTILNNKDTFPSAGIPVPGHWKSPSKNFSKKALTNFIFCVYTTTHKATALWNSIPGRLFLYHRTAGYPDPDSRGTHPAEHDPFPISPV